MQALPLLEAPVIAVAGFEVAQKLGTQHPFLVILEGENQE